MCNFGDAGVVTIQTSIQDGVSMADIAPLAGGKVLVLAYEIDANNLESNGFLYRLAGDGSIDPTFGDGGVVPVPVAQFARTISVQPDAKIVLGGAETFMRLLPDGSIDSTFGNDGITDASDRSRNIRFANAGRWKFSHDDQLLRQDLNLPAEIRHFDPTARSTGPSVTMNCHLLDRRRNHLRSEVRRRRQNHRYGQNGNSDEGFGRCWRAYTADGQPDQTFTETALFNWLD